MAASKQKKSTGKNATVKEKLNNGFSFCSQPTPMVRPIREGLSNSRVSAIFKLDKIWANGTTLRYYFFTNSRMRGTSAERDVVRNAFGLWKEVGIGLNFEEVTNIDDAEIRIGFLRGDGAWSYLGRDILHQAQSERTMNFGWNI